jgi:FeS assembly protein IscX
MISPVELRRILAEWRIRLSRAKEILQPPTWNEQEWRQFSQALALMVRDHGRSWIIEPKVYWDLRWNLQEGGELVCQIEHLPGEKTSLVVAQNGGFATEVGSYTWLWAEFNLDGNFSRDPYWVEGTWKDALTALLLPLDRQSSYLLAGRAQTPDSLLLQEGARPNDNYGLALMSGMESGENVAAREYDESAEVMPEEFIEPAEIDETYVSYVETIENEPTVEAPIDPASAEGDLAAEVPTTDDALPVVAENGVEKSAESASPRVDTAEPFAIRWGMLQKLTWKDTDEIAYSLIDAHPDQDPLKLSFPKLHKLVIALEDFGDDPDKSSESILESIQMAWYEEVK